MSEEAPMKTIVLCGIAAMIAAPALGQTSADPANKLVTMTGCVGSGSPGFTLGKPMVIPGTAQPISPAETSASVVPAPAPAAGVTPPAATGAVPSPASPAAVPPPATTTPTPGVPPATSPATPPASPAQAVPPASPAQGVPPAATGAVGAAGRTPTSVTGTSGVTAGGASNLTSGLGGYHLSGADMAPWLGQRVQVTGTFMPSAPTAARSTSTGEPGSPAAPPLEFRVQTVQAIAGPCPR
jgi:hypothetical protein